MGIALFRILKIFEKLDEWESLCLELKKYLRKPEACCRREEKGDEVNRTEEDEEEILNEMVSLFQ